MSGAGRDLDPSHASPHVPGFYVGAVFSWPIRVYWEDTDAGGVVYHAGYVCFLERVRTEWLRAMGIQQQRLRDRDDIVFVIRALALEYLRSARLDDALLVHVELLQIRGASFTVRQRIDRGAETLLTAQVRVACVSAGTLRPRPLPAWMLAEVAGRSSAAPDAARTSPS